jgi:hypothetical protein
VSLCTGLLGEVSLDFILVMALRAVAASPANFICVALHCSVSTKAAFLGDKARLRKGFPLLHPIGRLLVRF